MMGVMILPSSITPDKAIALLRGAGVRPDVMRASLTLGSVMGFFADYLGHSEKRDYWIATGLLHFVSRQGPLTRKQFIEAGADEEFLSIVAEGEIELDEVTPRPGKKRVPREEIPQLTRAEKLRTLLVTLDHLITFVQAVAETRPQKSVDGMKVSAVQKKFKDRRFMPSVSRAKILDGARKLRIEIGDFTSKTMRAICDSEEKVSNIMKDVG